MGSKAGTLVRTVSGTLGEPSMATLEEAPAPDQDKGTRYKDMDHQVTGLAPCSRAQVTS